MNQILSGLKVLDLTRLFPGPLCTMIMADYGAEVIKCEDTWGGDPMRFLGPKVDGTASFFHQLNRNKKCISINLKTDEGVSVLKRLAAESDVFLEGFRPGVMKRLGLDYQEIKKINSKIIYISISGYGQDGPNALKAGHDINFTALSGFMDINRQEGKAPVVSAIQTADVGGGALMALSAVMMALYQREKKGEGEYIDLSMTDGLIPWIAYASSYHFAGSTPPRGNVAEITGAFACYGVYETADGKYMALGAVEPEFWQRFCKFASREDWLEKHYKREEQAALKKEVAVFFKELRQSEWSERLIQEDFCCQPILDMESVAENPHMKHRNYFIEADLGNGKRQLQAGFPIHFSSDKGSFRNPAPALGANTASVLKEYGFNDEEIDSLDGKGVINK